MTGVNEVNQEKRNFWDKYAMEICYLLMVFFVLVRLIPSYDVLGDFWRSYNLSYYGLSYQTAGCFVARGLVGTVAQLISPTINSKIFYFVFWCIYVFFYSSMGLTMIKIIKTFYNKYLLFLIMCICIFNPAMLNYATDFARPDIFMLLLAIVCTKIIYHERFEIAVPVLCAAGMLIHEGFVVIFVPLIATYLLKKIIEKKRIMAILSFVLLIISSLVLFAVIMKYGKNSVTDVEALHIRAQETIDIPLNRNMIDFEQGTLGEELGNISFTELSEYKTKIALVFYTVMFLPIIRGYIKVLWYDRKRLKNSFVFALYLLAPFSGIIMVVAGVDYGRWFSMLISCCLVRVYYCLKEHQYNFSFLMEVKNKENLILAAMAVLVCYVTIGTMGDIHEHFDYINSLNGIFNYVKGILECL